MTSTLTQADFGTIGVGGPPDPAKDPLSAYRYLDTRRQTMVQAYRQRPLMRVWDENHNFIGTLSGEKSLAVEELAADSGQLNCVLRSRAWLAPWMMLDRRVEQDLHITVDPIPTQQDWPFRWGGKITSLSAKRKNDGIHEYEITALHNREHLKHIIAQANPVFPPELQIPKMWIVPMNVRTALSISLFVNLARQYFPFLAIPDNIFNPTSWIGTDLFDLNPMAWPLQVQWINPAFDTSRFEVVAARATDFHTLSTPLLEDAGCIWKAYTYLTTDKTSPNPELAGLGNPFGLQTGVFEALGELTADISRPTRNCVVFAVEDKSGIVGPTGTAADGVIQLISSTADDLLTDTIIPQYGYNAPLSVNPQGAGTTAPLIAQMFQDAPKPPWAIFYDDKYSGIIESQVTQHASTAKTVQVGGRSPGWVNDLITFGIKFALSQLQVVVTGGLGAGVGPAPIGAGLDEIYQGEFDDTLLAFQRFSPPDRELFNGDMAYLESQGNSTGTAYTISGILGLRNEEWKTRPFTSFKTSVMGQGYPYCLFFDINLGDRVGFQLGNAIYVDQISGYKYSYDDNTPLIYELSLASDNLDTDPVSKAMRGLAGIWNMFAMFAGSTELF